MISSDPVFNKKSNNLAWVAPFALLVCLIICLSACSEDTRAHRDGGIKRNSYLTKAETALEQQRRLAANIEALCRLAAKARPILPGLALRCCRKALESAEGLSSPGYLESARLLKGQTAGADSGQIKQRALKIAMELEQTASAAWPYRLVMETAAPLSQSLCRQARDLAMKRCHAMPPKSRNRALYSMVRALGPARVDEARRIALLITDGKWRFLAFRSLAGISRMETDKAAMQEAAERIMDPAASALALADCAVPGTGPAESAGRVAAEKAREKARLILDDKRRARINELIDYRLLSCIPNPSGVSPEVSRQGRMGFLISIMAGRGMIPGADLSSIGAYLMAVRQAQSFDTRYERAKAFGLAAAELAVLDADQAEAVLGLMPEGTIYEASRAKAALIVSRAGKSKGKAFEWNLEGVGSLREKFKLLTRMARLAEHEAWPESQGILKKRLKELLDLYPEGLELVSEEIWGLIGEKSFFDALSRLPDMALRAKILFKLSKKLIKEENDRLGVDVLQKAHMTIISLDGKQTLDKIAILGDMGRGWFFYNSEKAARFFEEAASAASHSVRNSRDSGSD